jgi:hypothetical protein
MRKTIECYLLVFPAISHKVQTFSLGLTDVVVKLGNGVMNSLFWTFFMTGSVSMAVSVLVLGYVANHFGLPVKDAIHRVLFT